MRTLVGFRRDLGLGIVRQPTVYRCAGNRTNVAGHQLSTGDMEEVLSGHKDAAAEGWNSALSGLEQVILVGRLVGDHHRVADDE